MILTLMWINTMMISKSGVQRMRRIPMLSEMVSRERSLTLGYQNKLRLMQYMVYLKFMPLERTSLCNIPAIGKSVIPSNPR